MNIGSPVDGNTEVQANQEKVTWEGQHQSGKGPIKWSNNQWNYKLLHTHPRKHFFKLVEWSK